jgi:hypothetical protein
MRVKFEYNVIMAGSTANARMLNTSVKAIVQYKSARPFRERSYAAFFQRGRAAF